MPIERRLLTRNAAFSLTLSLTLAACSCRTAAPPDDAALFDLPPPPPTAVVEARAAPAECVVGSPDPEAGRAGTLVLHYPRFSRRDYGMGAYMDGFSVRASPPQLDAARRQSRVILTRMGPDERWSLAQDISVCPGDPPREDH